MLKDGDARLHTLRLALSITSLLHCSEPALTEANVSFRVSVYEDIIFIPFLFPDEPIVSAKRNADPERTRFVIEIEHARRYLRIISVIHSVPRLRVTYPSRVERFRA